MRTRHLHLFTAAIVSALAGSTASSETLGGLPFPGGERIALVHAQGSQIYECKGNGQTSLAWQFREPIATLIQSGKTMGRHYAGPVWEFADGTVVSGKVTTQAPGASASDIPHLMLTVTSATGNSPLAFARTIVRMSTKGGLATGPCPRPGELMSVPYSADYAFFDAIRDN